MPHEGITFPFHTSGRPPFRLPQKCGISEVGTFCLYSLIIAMFSISFLGDLVYTLTSRYPIVLLPFIAASIFLATLYAARSNTNASIPLYVPETSAAGNQRKRWISDSVNLLQEAYQQVGDNKSILIVSYR